MIKDSVWFGQGGLKVLGGGVRWNSRWSHWVGECMNGPSVWLPLLESQKYPHIKYSNSLTWKHNIYQHFLSSSIIILCNSNINTNQRHQYERSKEISPKTPKLLFLLDYPIIQFPLLTCENKNVHHVLLKFSLWQYFLQASKSPQTVKTLGAWIKVNYFYIGHFSIWQDTMVQIFQVDWD